MQFPDIKQEVKDAILKARETGERIRKRFNRAEFVNRFPKMGKDPRVAFLPERFTVDIEPMKEIQVGELQDLCLACLTTDDKGQVQGNPLALVKAMSIQGLHPDRYVTILMQDYKILKAAVETANLLKDKLVVPGHVAKEVAAERAEVKEEKKKN